MSGLPISLFVWLSERFPARGRGEEFWIELCGRPVPAKNTEDGTALSG
jgi:hypothetical protein